MIRYTKGNLLESPQEALVNTVNTVGVMGKGIALQFKEAFPSNFKAYAKACKDGTLQIGNVLIFKEETVLGSKIIVNFPTKKEWYRKSQYKFIEDGLIALTDAIQKHSIKSIAIPPLGCGHGGLKWEKVKALIEKYLSQLNEVEIVVYEPNERVKEILKQQEVNKKVKLTPARAMLLYSMFYYETLGETSNLFVANKLAYFLQRLGESSLSKLKFQAHHYGPYSVQVVHMLHSVNGKFIKGLEQKDVKAFETLELQYQNVNEISDYVKKELKPDQITRLKKLLDLINGFQSSISLEVLASVDWVRKDVPGINKNETIKRIQNWSDRKRDLFHERYINIAFDHLEDYSQKLEIR